LGFSLNPSPESFRLLKTSGAFIDIDEDEVRFIHVNQEVIQKGMLFVEDKDLRIEFGLEKPDGTKLNKNILTKDEIIKTIQGHHKTLEKFLNEIDEPSVIRQFVEIARELKIDSKAKIDLIEAKSKMKIYEDEE
jgi:hypothetical protein